ncbi:MAG: hypothetical protein ACLGIC_13830 [Acidimicrobiia bacterium]
MTARPWKDLIADCEDVWNEADPMAMRTKLRSLFTPDARIFDPVFPTEMKVEDYANVIEYLRSQEPDNVVRFQVAHAHAGLPWARATYCVMEPGMEDFTGMIVAELDEGRIRTLVSFMDRETEEPAENT